MNARDMNLWVSDSFRAYEQALQNLFDLYGYVITNYTPGGGVKIYIPGVAYSGFVGNTRWTLEEWIYELKSRGQDHSDTLQARAARTARASCNGLR